MALTVIPPEAPTAQRFWAKVAQGDPADCWAWNSAHNRSGYGYFNLDGASRLAHRIAWQLSNGTLPEHVCVLHQCDNPTCCNPAHLFLGTRPQNTQDMVAKGRQATGDRHGSYTHPENRPTGERNGLRKNPTRARRGETHPMHARPELRPRGQAHGRSKLRNEQVNAIRELCATDQLSHEAIAEQFSVTRRTVDRIARRQTWGHL